MNRPSALLRFFGAYVAGNWKAALEYRGAFFAQVISMALNNTMWLVFWMSYFDRYPLQDGWGQREVVMLWSSVAAGYGLGLTLCGNVQHLARQITRGELDAFLAWPKPVYPHVLIARMGPSAPGDVLFGLVAFVAGVRPDVTQCAVFLLCMVTTAVILVSWTAAVHSLSFWLGDGQPLAEQAQGALTAFSTYPTSIFEGTTKALLFTLFPAGFMAYVPVELLRRPSLPLALGLVAFAALQAAAGAWVFHAGLRRYGSGNLLQMRE